MISIGGIIGAGLFVGSSAAIAAIGPAVIVSYLLAGVVVLMVMRMLGEMAAATPGVGSFTEYIRLGLGHWAGFVSGWLYWYFWVVVVAIEAIAGRRDAARWIALPVWQIGLVLMRGADRRESACRRASYGEFEFWFSSIKVAAIVSVHRDRRRVRARADVAERPDVLAISYAHGGFAPFGWVAVLAGVTTVVFSLCGAEIVTIAAAESNESDRRCRALTSTIDRCGSCCSTCCRCCSWWLSCRGPRSRPAASPFALALERTRVPGAATIMNLIVLTAVLSCLNSGVYVTSRVLFVLAAHARCAAVDGRAQHAARAGARDSDRQLVRLSRRVAVDRRRPELVFAFLVNASGAIMVIIYLLVRACADPAAAAARAQQPGAADDQGVVVPVAQLAHDCRDDRRARGDGGDACPREPAPREPRRGSSRGARLRCQCAPAAKRRGATSFRARAEQETIHDEDHLRSTRSCFSRGRGCRARRARGLRPADESAAAAPAAQGATGSTPAGAALAAPPVADELCFTNATDLVALIKNRAVSAREVMAAHLARIARVNPKLNAIVAKLDDERVPRARRRGRPRAGERRRRCRRCTACRPPSRTCSRRSASRSRAARRSTRTPCRPRTRVFVERMRARGRDPDRQDEHARVRHGLAHLQQGLRHDAESVRPHEERRRLERRRGRGARDRHAADRRRQRPRRLAAQSRQLQQHRRLSAQRRPRADVRRRRCRCSASR